jgi:hypothetical protein
MVDRAGVTARRATDSSAGPSKALTHLQVAYGNALIAARGFGAPETTKAFEKARESALPERGAPERLEAEFGLWAGSFTRGELPLMQAHAAALLADAETRPDSPEAGAAHRAQGITLHSQETISAREHLAHALALFQPGRDDDIAFRFEWTPASALWRFSRLRCGLSAISITRWRSSRGCWRA